MGGLKKPPQMRRSLKLNPEGVEHIALIYWGNLLKPSEFKTEKSTKG